MSSLNWATFDITKRAPFGGRGIQTTQVSNVKVVKGGVYIVRVRVGGRIRVNGMIRVKVRISVRGRGRVSVRVRVRHRWFCTWSSQNKRFVFINLSILRSKRKIKAVKKQRN
jgi:hypothetical protein